MRLPSPTKPQAQRAEQIILFRISGQVFAVSSASVKEVRSVDTLAGAAKEISNSPVAKVRHVVQRGEHSLYVVNGATHFGLPQSPAALVFILRRTRTALLVDGIEKMTSMTRLQALPQAFHHEERDWYRGLTAIDQAVIPVVKPEGFLTPDELLSLDSSQQASNAAMADVIAQLPADDLASIVGTERAAAELTSDSGPFTGSQSTISSQDATLDAASTQITRDEQDSLSKIVSTFPALARNDAVEVANAIIVASRISSVHDIVKPMSDDSSDFRFVQFDSDDSESYIQ